MARILHRGHSDDGLMRGEGQFEIKQGQTELARQLFSMEKIGRICYRSDEKLCTLGTAEKFIRSLIKRGHESVIEHSCLTVIFSNVSRGFTHEMVRHRLASFSQESTRYCDYAGSKLDLEEAELNFIYLPHLDLNNIDWHSGLCSTECSNEGAVKFVEGIYKNLRSQGWKPQDARQFLPIGIASKIAVTANFREWRHIMAMRTQKAAHWEIRYMMYDLLARLKERIPVVFEDFVNTDDEGELLCDANGYGYYRQIEWPEKGVV